MVLSRKIKQDMYSKPISGLNQNIFANITGKTNESKILHLSSEMKHSHSRPKIMPTFKTIQGEKERRLEREMIKFQYLGNQKERKKIAHPSERMRFLFDWDSQEDTSRDLNPLYDRPATLTMLFNRGIRGGIDRAEQQKIN